MTLEPLLDSYKEGLMRLYGDRLVTVLLFGSQARAEATIDSDIDILVVLQGEVQPLAEIERAGDLTAGVSLEYNTLVSPVFVSAEHFQSSESPLLHTVKREGIVL